MQNKDYTRAVLTPYLGHPVRAVGWMESWKASKKQEDKVGVLFTNATIAIGLTGQTVSVDHLWVYVWQGSLRKSLVSNKVGRLDRACFNGRISEYTRSDGSRDIGIKADPDLLAFDQFLKVNETMIRAGRWQSLIDLVQSDKILVKNPYQADWQAGEIVNSLAEIRAFAALNLEKVTASRSKCRGKPSGLKFCDLLR